MTVLYTAIFGGSDALKRAPRGPDRCVCFADDPALMRDPQAKGWDVRICTTPANARTAARTLKTGSHELFLHAERVVWADGSIEIRDWPRLLADSGDAEIACLPHPDRASCYEEAREVVRIGRADQRAIQTAVDRYRHDGFAPARLSTTGLLVRRTTPAVTAFNQLWRVLQGQYGTNDQVHVDYAAWKAGLVIMDLRGHYRDNPYMTYDRLDHRARRQTREQAVR